jgi:hypothetical protein
MQAGSLANLENRWQENTMPDAEAAIIRFGDMIVSNEGERPSPQAIYVDQPPNSTIPRHYHDNAQFQVVIGGSGTLGHEALQPIAVHYAAHQTVYGPIVSGRNGLVYLTLRAVTETGAHWWPKSRDHLRKGVRRWQVTRQGGAVRMSDLAKLEAALVETVIEPHKSGMGAWVLRLPPGGAATLPVHAGSAGQFHFVTRGTLRFASASYERSSIVWVDPEDAITEVGAGEEGLELVVTQFPRDALDA